MTDDNRIAIAGVGSIAEIHASSIGDISNATLIAGSCRTESRGRAFAEEYDCEWFAETERMLEEYNPDVLLVCTPSGAHLVPTLAAAERGVDVLCEKPLEITTGRIDRMADACEEAGVALGGIFQQRFTDLLREAHAATKADRFGDLSVANAYVPWWRTDDYYDGSWQGRQELNGGGAMMNQAIHGIDAVQWLVGTAIGVEDNENPVAEVFAYTDQLAHDEDLIVAEDTAVAVVRYHDGTIGQLLGSTSMYPGSRQRIQLAGRNGTVEVLEDKLLTWQFRNEDENDETVHERFGEDESNGTDPMTGDYTEYRRNIEAFLASRESDDPYLVDVVEARKAVAIVEAIYDSAERGEPVSPD